MGILDLEKMGTFEIVMLFVAISIVGLVLYYQTKFFKETRKKIGELSQFFPNQDQISKVETSINSNILESKTELSRFISNPPTKYVLEEMPEYKNGDESDNEDLLDNKKLDYSDVTLIQVSNNTSKAFKEVIYETNAYLCKNVGTSADFSILQDICERKLEALESQISNSINVPLYLGLGGTFVGIITGLMGIAGNVNELFDAGNMTPLSNLLVGVVIAMIASFVGLGEMIINSSINYKRAIINCDHNKNSYYDFLRRELMPTLSSSMASSLNSLKGVLGAFIGKFGHNLDAYANSAELLNDNIEKQHMLLVEINKMKQKEIAVEIAEVFGTLKNSSQSLNMFQSYQNGLNSTIEKVSSAVEKIDNIINSFDNFASALNVVVENQGAAGELQSQFRTAIEKHFPLGSDARELYRNQFDELTTDAKTVSEELNTQLKASTEYIQSFVEGNKNAFDSIAQINNVLNKLIEYSDVQASCYKDLKDEILALKSEQIKSQQNATQLNQDLLRAVKEMVAAVKTIKG